MADHPQNPLSRTGTASLSRRSLLELGGAALAASAFASTLPSPARAASATGAPATASAEAATIVTADGVEIFYKDWGPKDAQPIMFHHGWPLSSDDWDTQMLFFLQNGFRVVAHDRRGHGRSAQVSDGHDMDHYAADAFAVVEPLDLQERRPYRPFDRRRRGRALRRSAWRAVGPRRQGRPGRGHSAADAQDRRQSRAGCRSRSSTASARASPTIARSSIATSPPVPSTASTARARRPIRASSTTGGARA